MKTDKKVRDITLEKLRQWHISCGGMNVMCEDVEDEMYEIFHKEAIEELGEKWIDPAGGIHFGDESDPAAMYI